MSDNIAISVQNVSKSFRLPHERYTGLKQALINFRFGKHFEVQHVLKDISFDIRRGEFFGIVGRNGSGKSTLLKVLAQIYTPEQGGVHINGSLTPFIELGVGFNPELTGRENVFLNGALLGFDRKQMTGLYPEIVEFAELEEFMDQKLKNYSSGMQVRLAFSVAIRAQSDILLVDEVLAVGDAAFQTKCFDYFYELKKKGTTVIFVSHDKGSLERFCDRGILIDKGRITEQGDINKVLQAYTKVVLEELGKGEPEADPLDVRPDITSEYLTIADVSSVGPDGATKTKFSYGEPIELVYTAKFTRETVNPVLGVTVWQKNLDKAVFAVNTIIDGKKETGIFKPGDALEFRVKLPAILNDGEYFIEPAVANESTTVFYDQRPKAASFFISGSVNPHSLVSAEEKIVLRKTA